jgi:hypothetical protein
MSSDGAAALRSLMTGLGKSFSAVGKNGVSMTSSGLDIEGALTALVKKQVLVGIPATNAPREDGDPINNAARLYIHEHGAPEANIPARPTLMPGIADVQDAINKYLQAAARAALSGDASKIDVALHSAGTVARDSVKTRIGSNTPPPLAERTLQDRRARGKASENTLVDSGEMRNAVTYVISEK